MLSSDLYSVFDVNLIFRSEVIALMKEISGYSLPLFKFIEMFEKRSVVDVAFNVLFFCVLIFYRPPKKLWEDNVFSRVCLSVQREGFPCDHCKPLQTCSIAPPPFCPPRTCSNLFTWDPQHPLFLPYSLSPSPDLFKVTHLGKREADLRPPYRCVRMITMTLPLIQFTISWFVLTLVRLFIIDITGQ